MKVKSSKRKCELYCVLCIVCTAYSNVHFNSALFYGTNSYHLMIRYKMGKIRLVPNSIQNNPTQSNMIQSYSKIQTKLHITLQP